MSKQSKQLKLVVKSGRITAIHDDALTVLFNGADVSIKRASHVEPREYDATWTADLSPVGGPKFESFKTRQEALDMERWYLDKFVVA